MGEIKVKIDLENYADRFLFLDNKFKEDLIRKHQMEAIVDTGAVMLVLPQDVTEKLGLKVIRSSIVKYADDRKEERNISGPVAIKINNRYMATECVVGPPASEALIGQTILETLDLIPDPQNRTLSPRPESPIYPMLNIK